METAYIETTVASYYVARTSDSLLQAAKQGMTRRWWDSGWSGFQLFTSLETLDEAGKGDPRMAADRLDLIRGLPLLSLPDEGLQLASRLVESGIVRPRRHRTQFTLPWHRSTGWTTLSRGTSSTSRTLLSASAFAGRSRPQVLNFQ